MSEQEQEQEQFDGCAVSRTSPRSRPLAAPAAAHRAGLYRGYGLEHDPGSDEGRLQRVVAMDEPLGSRCRRDPAAASWVASGTHIAVSSPARSSRARVTVSRRLVLTRSLGLFGISDGATTVHSCPSSRICRYSP
jgi:hypothetical protein